MLWVARLFEERYTPVRLTIVALSGVGYLTLVPEGRAMSTIDLVIAIGVIIFSYVTIWSPFTVACGVSIVLALGYLGRADDDSIPTVALAWTLFELGARRSGWRVWFGLLIGMAGGMLSDVGELLDAPLTILYGVSSATVVPLLVGLYVRALGDLNRQAAERARREVDLVRADERTSIARELHDLVAHHVASIVLRVAVARDVLPMDDPRVRQVLVDVHGTGSGALADLRRLVALLRDPGSIAFTSFVEPEGLPVALDSTVDRSRQIGLSVETRIDPAIVRLDARTALALLRLTQEGLANVAKHAGPAAQASLSIRLDDDHVEFELSDSGGRAGPVSEGPSDGHGLIGLRERVEVLGGRLRAGPTDSGWRLAALVPVGAAQ